MTKILPAKLTICRFTGGPKSEGVCIRITDNKSCTCIVELEISIEDFGRAIMGLSDQPCEATWKINNLGLKYEHTTQFVPYEYNYSDKRTERELKQKSLEPFEIDGWKGRIEDLGNPHKSAKGGYNVSFMRWVKDE